MWQRSIRLWNLWPINLVLASVVVSVWLFGCFGSPNLRGLYCKEDADCLNIRIKCLDGFCGGPTPSDASGREVGGESLPEGACQSPTVACNNTCVDANTNKDHCGECGRTCAAGQVCSQGTCTSESVPYAVCHPTSRPCTGAFACVRINPISQANADLRCLRKCSSDAGCNASEGERCNTVTLSEPTQTCFSTCRSGSCNYLNDSTLFCNLPQAPYCLSGTCSQKGDKCWSTDTAPAVSYACVDASRDGASSASYRCLTGCKVDQDCPTGHSCRCERGQETCGAEDNRHCFAPCEAAEDCQKALPGSACITKGKQKLCLYE